MKKRLAFLALFGKIGYDKTMRATLVSGLAIALGLAGGVPTAQADDGVQCQAYNAASVDANFLEWSDATGFDASSGTIACLKLAGDPTIMFRATTEDNRYFFQVTVAPSSADPSFRAAEGVALYPPDDFVYWSNMEDVSDYLLLSVPQSYACRAEILRSFTWREYCTGP